MKTNYWYTLGRIISDPSERQSKSGKSYKTVYVELFGGMRVSALAGAHEIHKGDFVGMKITPTSNGQAAYHIIPLDASAEEMLLGAVSYLQSTPTTVTKPSDDDDVPELPF